MTEPHAVDGQAKNADVLFEPTDVQPRGVLIFAGVLAGVAVVIHIVLLWLFFHERNEQRVAKESIYPLPAPPFKPQIPQGQPVLEGISTSHDVGRYGRELAERELAAEEERLRTYGWVDQKVQIVRIPIRDAMKLALEQNKLPTRKEEGRR